MKKIFLLCLFFLSSVFAQTNTGNGRISFTLNDEKIDLPINSVSITKQKNIILSLRCEYNDEKVQQMIGLDIAFKQISTDPSMVLTDGTKISVDTRDKINRTGKNLTIWFGITNSDERNVDGETANYEVFDKGQKANWLITSKLFKLIITKVQYSNDKLIIDGKFDGTFSSNIAPKGIVANIKDGKFEIII
jgi:hypothetical protein